MQSPEVLRLFCLSTSLFYVFLFKVSAASSEIEATVGEHYPVIDASGNVTLDAKGSRIPNYDLTQAIFMGCVFAGSLLQVSQIRNDMRVCVCALQ